MPWGRDREIGWGRTARFQAGEPLRALLLSLEEADQILRGLTSKTGPTASETEPFLRYREEVGERIVEPFAKGAAELAAARDLDGLLDRLEVLHVLPIRVPAMERLWKSVASLFPEPGPGRHSRPGCAREGSENWPASRVRRRCRPLPPQLRHPATIPSSAPQVTIDAGVEVFGLALLRPTEASSS